MKLIFFVSILVILTYLYQSSSTSNIDEMNYGAKYFVEAKMVSFGYPPYQTTTREQTSKLL